MSKSVLVIDTPENCMQCPLFDGADECIMQDDDTNFNADTIDELMQTCPLMDLPEKEQGDGIPVLMRLRERQNKSR